MGADDLRMNGPSVLAAGRWNHKGDFQGDTWTWTGGFVGERADRQAKAYRKVTCALQLFRNASKCDRAEQTRERSANRSSVHSKKGECNKLGCLLID